MNPYEYMQSLTELWSRGGRAFVSAQQSVLQDMARGLTPGAAGDGALPLPGLPVGAEEFEAARKSFLDVWSAALQLSTTMNEGLQRKRAPSEVASDTLGRIFDPRLWFSATDDLDQVLQRLAEGPRLADLWEVERKLLDMFNSWLALRRASLDYNTVMLQAWIQAAGSFAKALNDKAERGEILESWGAVLEVWAETANTALLEAQRSDAFLKAQRNVLKASTDLRLAQQKISEFYSEMFGYPTRRELDDVHRALTELRREFRAFQRSARPVRKKKGKARTNE